MQVGELLFGCWNTKQIGMTNKLLKSTVGIRVQKRVIADVSNDAHSAKPEAYPNAFGVGGVVHKI